MCKSPLHPLLSALPKCEHHVHLEGCITPSLLFELAVKNNIPLPADAEYSSIEALTARYDKFTSLADFLNYYTTSQSVFLNASDFEALGWSYFTRAHADGVIHAEVFFDPQAHTLRSISFAEVVSGFTAACGRAERELGMSTLLIMCFLRHLPVSSALQHMAIAMPELRNGTIAGIGVDSNELGYPPELFKEIYATASAHQIRRTAHAGEEGPAEYVEAALNHLNVQRIDHGIRLASSPELIARVAREKILITVCPLSNVLLRCVDTISELPIRTFLDAGVPFSLNSDDPAFFGGYILDNWCAVQEAFDLTVDDWGKIAEASIEGSWCGAERKDVMRGLTHAVFEAHQSHIT